MHAQSKAGKENATQRFFSELDFLFERFHNQKEFPRSMPYLKIDRHPETIPDARVGNGESIHIGCDRWLSRAPSGKLISTQGTCWLRRVAELLYDRGTWRMDLLHRYFHPTDVQVISNIRMSPRLADDILA